MKPQNFLNLLFDGSDELRKELYFDYSCVKISGEKILTTDRLSSHASVVARSNFVWQWILSMGEGVFLGPPDWKPPGRSRLYFAHIITSVRPRDRTKVKLITPGFCLPNKVKLQLLCFLLYLILSTGRTCGLSWLIMAQAEAEVPLRGATITTYFIKGLFSPKISKFPTGLAGSGKTIERLRHIFTNNQPINIRQTSNDAACDRAEYCSRKI